MDWRVKALIQKTISYLPQSHRIHHRIQRKFGAFRDLEGECGRKIADWEDMMRLLDRADFSLQDAVLLEIGTGWYPTFPFCLYLAGARSVITLDLTRHLQADFTRTCARMIGRHLDQVVRWSSRSPGEVARLHASMLERLENGADLAEATEGAVSYRAPADASRTGLADASVDAVFSNSVLEHVPRKVIVALLEESKRILRSGGVVYHGVNCGDHYSYVDPSVSQLNYLRFSEREWRRWNNAFLWQNRLRAVDFERLVGQAGLEMVVHTAQPSEQRLRELADVPVAGCFGHYTREELCVTTIDFVARKTAVIGGGLCMSTPGAAFV
jgi:SAM-dependent methyltransferase